MNDRRKQFEVVLVRADGGPDVHLDAAVDQKDAQELFAARCEELAGNRGTGRSRGSLELRDTGPLRRVMESVQVG